MKRTLAIACMALALPSPAMAGDDPDFEKEVKLEKGKAKISFTAVPVAGPAVRAAAMPRIGIGASNAPNFSAYVGQSLERTRKAGVVSASQLGMQMQATQVPAMLDSEVQGMVSGACARGKLDFLLFVSSGLPSMKTDLTARVFGFGRMRLRTPMEARLYSCKTKQVAWHQQITVETSRGTASMSFSGSTAGLAGGPEAERKLSEIFAEKLVADLSL